MAAELGGLEAALRRMQLDLEAERRAASKSSAGPTVGSCMEMCPAEERLRRQLQNRLHPSERVPGTGDRAKKIPPTANPATAVKEYSRPAAGVARPVAAELRPAPVLQHTVNYLLSQITLPAVKAHDFGTEYGFVTDRLRAVRQDMIIQQITGQQAIAILEGAARFLLFSTHAMGKADLQQFDPTLHRQQLNDTLASLMYQYDLIKPAMAANEALFRAVLLITFSDDSRRLRAVASLPSDLRNTPEMRTALAFVRARSSCNYARYFRLYRQCPDLLACAASLHLSEMRHTALEIMVKGYGAPQCAMPVEGVAARLCSSPAGVEALCRVHHVAMSEGKVQFRRAEFQPAAKADSMAADRVAHGDYRGFRIADCLDIGQTAATDGRCSSNAQQGRSAPQVQPDELSSLAQRVVLSDFKAGLCSDEPPSDAKAYLATLRASLGSLESTLKFCEATQPSIPLNEDQNLAVELLKSRVPPTHLALLCVSVAQWVAARSGEWGRFKRDILNALQRQHSSLEQDLTTGRQEAGAVQQHAILMINVMTTMAPISLFGYAQQALSWLLQPAAAEDLADNMRLFLCIWQQLEPRWRAAAVPSSFRPLLERLASADPQVQELKQLIRHSLDQS